MKGRERWFDMLLRLLPARFRSRHADAMRETFVGAWAGHRARGRLAAAAFLLRTTLDLVGTGAREHLRPGGRATGPVGRGAWLDPLRQDVRFALRTFRRTPAFTAIAVVTLALGIGANTAIFSGVNALLLRPLPFPEPGRLMNLTLTVPPRGDFPARDDVVWSWPKFQQFRSAQTAFVGTSLWESMQMTLRVGDQTLRDVGEFTDDGYLPTLGIAPALGRNFTAGEGGREGGEHVALISDALWQRLFAADRAVLGRALSINGVPYTVIGVMAPGFRGLSGDAVIWLPLVAAPNPAGFTHPYDHQYNAIGRLAAGTTPEQAAAQVRVLGDGVDAAYPDPGGGGWHWGATAEPLDAARIDPRMRDTLVILLGAVGLVLLIACANVANLFLARASARHREISVRLAVGASRSRLVRQLLTESVLLALAGGTAGLAVAWAGTRGLATLRLSAAMQSHNDAGIGLLGSQALRLDSWTLLFTLGLCVGTGVIFGLVPALQSSRPSLTHDLKDDGGTRRSRWGVGSRDVLVAAEIALAVVLLAGAGVVLRSLAQRMAVDPGFDASHMLTFQVNRTLEWAPDSITQFYDVAIRQLSGLPGVTGVAMSDCPPLSPPCAGVQVGFRDRPDGAPGTGPQAGFHWITPGWNEVARVPLVRGRLLSADDRPDTPLAVLISEAAARQWFPDEDPIGQALTHILGAPSALVVGVVGDVHYQGLDEPPRPEIYVSLYQVPFYYRMMLFIRTTGDPSALAGPARATLAHWAPGFPVYDVRTGDELMGGALAYARISSLLLGLFAAVALSLAAIGIYGLIAFTVAQRAREIGVRVAMGATGADVVRMVIRQALLLGVVGGGVGLVGARAATRVLSSLLYGVAPDDPLTLAAIVAVLTTVVLLASWLPARRAARVDPVLALKSA